jgi:hypothetical protein
MDATPVVVQGVLHEAGRLFTGGNSGKLVTLFDASGRPAIASVESEVLTLTHVHPSFTDTVMIAAQASYRGELGPISDLISRVELCRDKHKFHLAHHDCTYSLKSRPAHSSASFVAPVSERLVNVKGVVESHSSEHETLLLVLQNIFQQALERQGLCKAPVMTSTF